MFKNYFTIAIRNLKRNKVFSFINIAGLAIGISASLVIYLIVQHPEEGFNYQFYDQTIASFYKSEQNISRLLKWAAGLCILISCLGLLGLVIYITNTRNKEIGVRKVLGASVMQIVSLLSKDFIALVAIAFFIALPVAWWAMNSWLQDFSYRTSLSWWVFGATGTGMLLIAILTLSIRTIKSAIANPAKSLRTE